MGKTVRTRIRGGNQGGNRQEQNRVSSPRRRRPAVSRVLSLLRLPSGGDGHSSRPTVTGGLQRLPGGLGRAVRTHGIASGLSCSGWGLPCDPRHRGPGALLPHPFTLTRQIPPESRGSPAGGLLSVALSFGSPRLGVTQHPCPVELGLSSRASGRRRPPHRLRRGLDMGIMQPGAGQVNRGSRGSGGVAAG